MNTNLTVIHYLYQFSITLLLVISVITTFNRKSSSQNAGILLAVFNWVFFYAAVVGYLVFSGKIVALPHLFRTANICLLIYFPLSYLYIVQSFSPRRFRYMDLLHFLPVLIFIVDFAPFYLKSGAEKADIYNRLAASGQIGAFKEGLFMPAYLHLIIRYLLMMGYWIAQVLFVKKALSAKGNQLKRYNSSQVSWIKWLIASQLVIFVPALPSVSTGTFDVFRTFIQAWALIAASIQAYYLFFHPEILYGIQGIVIENKEIPHDETISTASGDIDTEVQPIIEKQQVQYISDSMLDKIQLQLDEYMQLKKPFLQQGFGLIDLADATGFTPHQVSGYINKRCEMNFFSYINKHRIEYCKQKFVSKEYIDKTIEAISHESGFQSRATFIRAFKTNTGFTPSEFIKEIKTASNPPVVN